VNERDELAREAWSVIGELMFGSEQFDRVHDAAESVGLPHPGALKALLSIDDDDPPSMRDVARQLRCDASYVTGLVDALEGLGYVERRPHPSDRRVKLLAVTPAGRRARDQARAVLGTPPAALSRLTDAEITTLARLARKLR